MVGEYNPEFLYGLGGSNGSHYVYVQPLGVGVNNGQKVASAQEMDQRSPNECDSRVGMATPMDAMELGLEKDVTLGKLDNF